MATQVIMPQLGESVVEGKVSRWLKKIGDEVEQYEPILEVETDKVTTEVTAAASGVLLAILVQEGLTVTAGTPLAYIGQPGETPETGAQVMAQAAPPPKPLAAPTPARPAFILPPTIPAPRPMLPGDELLPHTAMRRSIAEHMARSKHASPHATTVFEVDMSRVLAHREVNQAAFERDGARLTLTAYFVAAAAAALQAYPMVNSTFTDSGLLIHKQINIGIAVSLGAEGLIVPVLRNAEQLSLRDIARGVGDLAQRARGKKLLPDDVTGSTFAITNHGSAGSLFATPVINQPNVAILGVGALQKRPVVVPHGGADTFAIRPMLYVGLTFDHRVLDGASADAFLAHVKQTLENWT